MSWIRSSETLVISLGLIIVLALGAVGTAAAIELTETDVPDELEVGEETTVGVTIEDPYADVSGEYELSATTEFESGQVQISATTPSGDSNTASGGDSLTVAPADEIEEITVEATGTVPDIGSNDGAYSYENPEQEQFTALDIDTDNGPVGTVSVDRFTENSQQARGLIDEAVSAAGEDATSVQSAISLYDSGEFDQAITQAQDVIDEEGGSGSSPLPLIVGGAVVVIGLAGGGYYLYTQRQQDTHKLQ